MNRNEERGTGRELPAALAPLDALAHNLRWAWHYGTRGLFRTLDEDLWERSGHNPVAVLKQVAPEKLAAAAASEAYRAELAKALAVAGAYRATENQWFCHLHPEQNGPLVAYFCAEFGLTECLQIYSGGLGVLAADHIKSASDLGLPLVAVGLLYRQGYYRQYLDVTGRQREAYDENDFQNLPLRLVRDAGGEPLTVEAPGAQRPVRAQVWRVEVGNVSLFLLDADLPANQPEDRTITERLYGGDAEMRLRQEVVLGIGGYRALEALGLRPTVYHMNEGHAAFLALEHVRRLMADHGLSFDEAREAAAPGLVFTSHTPVAAGHDYFEPALLARHLEAYAGALGLGLDALLGLGRRHPDSAEEYFCMTVLSLRLAGRSNCVSRLHEAVTRQMWADLWPNLTQAQIPIGHVTNAVHFPSWISGELKKYYDERLTPSWRQEVADQSVWAQAREMDDATLWGLHQRRREKLVAFARREFRAQKQQQDLPESALQAVEGLLDPHALTLGFARRFATYKRALLLFTDPERLARLLGDPARPVQIVFAGKAHPADEAGKDLIQRLVALSQEPRFHGRVVFLENYTMNHARYLVQGVDVWVNTPLRLREASGTSGMKAAANGVLNLSILDGWWDEAYQPEVGWAIRGNEALEDEGLRDRLEAEVLYNLLENEVVPTFYDRGPDGLPHRWIARMKAVITRLCARFNTHRMVGEYLQQYYLPGADLSHRLAADGMARARALAAWKARLRAHWPQLAVERLGDEGGRVRARVRLGALSPADVRVEAWHAGAAVEMRLDGPATADGAVFASARPLPGGGARVCVRACHEDLPHPVVPGLVAWEQAAVAA